MIKHIWIMNTKTERLAKKIAIGIGIGILCVLAFGLLIYLLQYLWNWLVPSIIGWRAISYWEALGLFVLSKLLFKGIHFSGGDKRGWGNKRWESRLAGMTPEERERFKQKMREKCGWYQPKQVPTDPNNQ
jgi:hypothetical protein